MFTLEHVNRYRGLPPAEKRWHLASLMAFAAIVAGGFHLCHWFWVSPPGNTYRSRTFDALSRDTRVLVVGTSHVQLALRPELFTHETAAISAEGLDYVCMEAILKQALERAPRVELVIVEIDHVPLLIDHVALFGDRQLADWGITLGDLKQGPVGHARSYVSLLKDKRFTPTRTWLRSGTPEPGLAESALPDRVIDASRDAADLRARFDEIFTGDLIDRQRALIRMIHVLEARNIPVKLMRLPMHASYWPEVRPEWEDALLETLEMIPRETHVSLDELWDYASLTSLENADFRDADHLNASGAAKFSHVLDARIRAHLDPGAESLAHRLQP